MALVLVVLVVGAFGSAQAPPATGAAALVPGDALAYVNVSTDAGRTAVGQALALAARFPDYPLLSAAVMNRVDAILGGGGVVDFSRDVRPWLGKEAAFALLNTTGSSAGSLIVLDDSRPAAARAFLTRSGAVAAGADGRVALLRYPSGAELAFIGRYLVLGQDASVRAAIAVAAGGAGSLAADPGYRRAAAGEPADRVLDAYISAAGVRRILAPRSGVLGALGALLSGPALTGVTVSVSALPGGARLRIHTALDPSLARLAGPGGSASGAPFAPTLQNVIPAGASLMYDGDDLGRVAPRLLGVGAAGGFGGGIAPLLQRLGAALRSEGVNVGSVMSVFDREVALASLPVGGKPTVIIVARTPNQAQARVTLASLELPLQELFPTPSSGPGQAPSWADQQLGGITAQSLSLAPGLQIDYAVLDGLVVVSTSLSGIEDVSQRARALADDSRYHAVLGESSGRLTSLLFLDLNQLLSLGEQTGLTRSARLRALTPDLDRIHAVGLESTSGEADSTAELSLQIP